MAPQRVATRTRTGNTALPDKFWSDWSDGLTVSPSAIASAKARYIQVRATLAASTNAYLEQLRFHFAIQNQAPRVRKVSLASRANEDEAEMAPPREKTRTPRRRDPQNEGAFESENGDQAGKERDEAVGVAAEFLTWEADDSDGDTLVYRLFYRGDDDPLWIPVPLRYPLQKSKYLWKTDAVPDGRYRIKVVASDELSNPADRVLKDEKVSDVILVDNRRPQVRHLSFDKKARTLSGLADDGFSLIAEIRYAIDGGEWLPVMPADGILDSRQERFVITLKGLTPGPHSVAVRVTDEKGNAGVEKLGIGRD